MAETVEQKQARLDKLKAQQRALLDRAKAVELRIRRAESADKRKSKKQDDRTKLILGVAVLHAAKKDPQVMAMLKEVVRGLPPKDLGFLSQESALWAELGENPLPAAHSAAAQPPHAPGGAQ